MSTLSEEEKAVARLRKAAQAAVAMYIANPKTKYEFISCVTPEGPTTETKGGRMWRELRDALEAFK